MINLLSTERKADIRAARTNVILTRYIGIILIAVIFLLSVLYVSHTVLKQTMDSAEARISSNDTKADVYSSTKQQVDALSTKLNDAKVLLDQEVSYAQILTSLGKAMPTGTYLENLTINNDTIAGTTPIELTAYAKTDTEAATIQQSLQASGLFTIVSLSGTSAESTNPQFPVKVTLNATFNRAGL